MRVQEVMTTKVRTVTPATSAAEAWSLMKTGGIRHLVVMEGRNIIGVVSERDGRGARARDGYTVQELMTRHPATITQDATVRQAANLMRGRTIGCLPVTRGNRLVGIVTTSDLLDAVRRGVDRPASKERHTLNYKTPHRGRNTDTGLW